MTMKSALKKFSDSVEKKDGSTKSGTSQTRQREKTSRPGDLSLSLRNIKNQFDNEDDPCKKKLIKKVIDCLESRK